MPLEPVKHSRTRIIDIDGTIIKKKLPEDYFSVPTEVLSGAIERVSRWYDNGDYIVFWTARPKEYRSRTMDMLDELGFKYHELVCDKPYCHEIHIYDDNPMFFHQIERDIGIGADREDRIPGRKLYEMQAAEIRRLRNEVKKLSKGE